MKLYYSPGACSLSPHIVLRETGQAFELEKVDLRSGTLASGGSFREISVKGYVPALQLDNGEVLTEGPAIVQYLADLAPQTGLAPASGTLARARLQEWLNFISTEIHKSMGAGFSGNEALKQAGQKTLTRHLPLVATTLARQPYLLGEQCTVADIYLFVVLGWSRLVGFDLSPWPVLGEHSARIAARPAVQAALRAEGLLN